MDKAEFEKIIRSVEDRAFRLALSMLADRDEAEDAVQDVLEKLWRNRTTAGNYQNPQAFVLASVRNLCVDRIRNRNMRREKADNIVRSSERTAEIGEGIDTRDINEAIARIIAELPEKQKTVIHLRDIEEMEYADIARITGMDETNIRVALSRARKAVRDELVKIMNYGITISENG